MAKINLLTIHWGNCYGAVLQTYATCKLLESYGHEVTVINLIHSDAVKKFTHIKEYTNLLAHFQFWKFKKRYFSKMTHKMQKIDMKYIPNADYTVVGSDQVWNRNITTYLASNFFLDFADNKLVALSSSIGRKCWEWDSNYTLQVEKYLRRFQSISVREDSAVDILKKIFDIDSTQLLDPTLAYGKFTSFVKKDVHKQRIFSFTYNNSNEAKRIKKGISQKLGLPLYVENAFTHRLDASPIDWLNNIYNAEFVITDSFHGVAFCLIFQKNFIVLCANKKQFTRIESLLRKIGLLDRVIYSFNELMERDDVLHNSINWDIVNKILDKEREAYNEFILKNFKN